MGEPGEAPKVALVAKELPESQCGFRRGHGCTDMIFTVRQLTEKAIEYQSKQYLILRKSMIRCLARLCGLVTIITSILP